MDKYGDDKFWDLASFVGKDKKTEAQGDKGPSPESDVTLVGIDDKFVPYKRSDAYRPSQLSAVSDSSPVSEYAPESKMFVMNVSLSRSGQKSASDFEKKAREMRARKGREVPYVQFYSSLPLYYNLTPQSCEYYLWWRDSFLRGDVLTVDWSYISLYLSELINRDDGDACEAVRIMWRLYEAYSDVGSVLYVSEASARLPEIICDYSLIHNVGIPSDISEKTICRAAGSARFREFFFDRGHPASAMLLLTTLCSEYDYDKSKFAPKITVNNARSYIYGAVKYCADKAATEKFEHPLSGSFRERTTITRFSYSNFIFVLPKYTYVLRVDFCSVNRSYVLRNTVTGIIKQCENRLRTHSGIKAKLRVFSLEPFFRDAVDEYLDASLPRVKQYKPEKKKPEPEYERLYEREVTEFSLDNAKKIEERSWSVTERLIDGMDGYVTEEPRSAAADADRQSGKDADFEIKDYIEAQDDSESAETPGYSDELSGIISAVPELKDFLFALYYGNYAVMLRKSDALGLPVSLIVDRINEAAFDVIGDTLIEESGDGYEIIPDYAQLFDGVGAD